MTQMFLIGEGITHSLSPAMWNHYLEKVGSTIRYSLRDVSEHELPAVLDEIRSGDVFAANVTMPHKGWAARSADETSHTVRRTGAANLLVPGDRVRAENTDVIGARMILQRRAPYRTVLVLGAGGTASALTDALRGLAEHLLVANRTRSRADILAERIREDFAGVTVIDWDHRNDVASNADLVISSVPTVDTVPVDPQRLGTHAVVYDAIYRNTPTVFQRALADRGVAMADGLSHLAAQAIAMFDLLGLEPYPSFLVEGLERATGREVAAFGEPIS